jgi:16S rRNA (cytidine1402-2'-O)-methyltransferase
VAKLYLIPTPIGNLEDITLRAVRLLKELETILAEDTRNSQVLLHHFGIEKRLVPYHQHNEHEMTPLIIRRLKVGENIGMITDAGTPGISDPGFLLVRECVKEAIAIDCLPGATAFVPALIQSGFPNNQFCFEGFLPHKKGRETRLKELAAETRTLIFYESPARLVKTLEQLATHFGKERTVSVSRELTKLHEETKRGTLEEVAAYFSLKEVKGEIVIVLSAVGKNH